MAGKLSLKRPPPLTTDGFPAFLALSDTSRAGDKYETTSTVSGYTKYMKLKIRAVGPNDFGTYRCVAKNSLGETDGNIKLDGKREYFASISSLPHCKSCINHFKLYIKRTFLMNIFFFAYRNADTNHGHHFRNVLAEPQLW